MLGYEAGGKLFAEPYPNETCERRKNARRRGCEERCAAAVLGARTARVTAVGARLRRLFVMAVLMLASGTIIAGLGLHCFVLTQRNHAHRGRRHAAQRHQREQRKDHGDFQDSVHRHDGIT